VLAHTQDVDVDMVSPQHQSPDVEMLSPTSLMSKERNSQLFGPGEFRPIRKKLSKQIQQMKHIAAREQQAKRRLHIVLKSARIRKIQRRRWQYNSRKKEDQAHQLTYELTSYMKRFGVPCPNLLFRKHGECDMEDIERYVSSLTIPTRKALLIWHPDKFQQVLDRLESSDLKAKIADLAKTISNVLTTRLDKAKLAPEGTMGWP
jgi:hypothetical protein